MAGGITTVLTALVVDLDGVDTRVTTIEADYALGSELSALDARVFSVEGTYLEAGDLSGYATETYVDSAVAGADLSAYALDVDLDGVDTRVTAIEADYLQAADLAGYATETWVVSQGYSTDSVDATLVDLADYLSVDPSTDSVVFDGANVYIQSGAGSTDATVNGVGNLFVGYNEDDSFTPKDRTGSHNLVVGMVHSYSSWGGVIGGYENTVSGAAAVAFGVQNESSGDYSSVSGGSGGEASGDYSSISGGIDNTASGLYSSVSGGYGNMASGTVSSVSGGESVTATGESDWAAGGLWEDN